MKGMFHTLLVLVPVSQSLGPNNHVARSLRSARHHHKDHNVSRNGNLRWASAAAEALESFGVHNTAGPEANLCRNGKLLPSFYLLGGPKCATTTASMELGRFGGIRAAPKLWSRKEWHFWENFAPNADADSVRKAFRSELDACPDDRLVLGDFSVNNLAAVPAPDDMELSPCSCEKSNRRKGHVKGGDVPRLLSTAYGKDISNVTLMMLIRSPVSRMQSSWYHAKAEDFTEYWGFMDCCTKSFNVALKTIIAASNKTQDPPKFKRKIGGEGSVWASMFGRHIDEYLKYFDAKQILIVPYKQYLDRETRIPICADLRRRLNIGLNCTNHDDFHENIHPHPPLEEDVDAETLDTMNRMFEEETGRLLEALANAGRRGASLAGFSGDVGNPADIESWLTANW